ncbi:hypothetical protein FKM82_006710 [Ascaphus truei]
MSASCGLWYRGREGLCLLLMGILLTWLVPDVTESQNISLQPGNNITILIKPGGKSPPSPPCYICTIKDGCKLSTLQIRPGMNVIYNYSCLNPEKYFVMEIQKVIDCTSSLCPFGNVALQPSSLPGLNRTFSWHVATARNMGLELNFSTPWLRQINSSDKCPDLVTFDISTSLRNSPVNIGTFCRNGTVSRIKVQGGGIVALYLPWYESLTQSGFRIANQSSIKRLCIIESTFQTESSATLLSANYDLGFPEDELMTWQFIVPPNHRASVQFLNYTLPNCDRKTESVEYYLPESYTNPVKLDLQKKQPASIGSNFNMSLQGCDMDDKNPGALRLLFTVTVQQSSMQGCLTIILIAAIAAVGAVILAVTVTVCCVRKKKKEKLAPVGIYDGKLQTEMPRRRAFFKKGKKKNDSHIYAVIEDTMVYGHLLKDPNGSVSPEVDVYQPFEGPMEDAPPVPRLNFLNGSTKEEDLEDHLSLSMRENELYVSSELIPKEPVENDDTSMAVVEGKRNGTLPST